MDQKSSIFYRVAHNNCHKTCRITRCKNGPPDIFYLLNFIIYCHFHGLTLCFRQKTIVKTSILIGVGSLRLETSKPPSKRRHPLIKSVVLTSHENLAELKEMKAKRDVAAKKLNKLPKYCFIISLFLLLFRFREVLLYKFFSLISLCSENLLEISFFSTQSMG